MLPREYRELQDFISFLPKGCSTQRCSVCFTNVFISEPDQDENFISDRDELAIEVLNMVGLRIFCLLAHSHRKLKPTKVCQGDSSSLWDTAQDVVRDILVFALLLPVIPVLFLLGTLGYISRRIKCIGAFDWRILKVYFPTGTPWS